MDTATVKASLEQRLAELESRLEHIKRDQVQPHSSDSAEQAQERENDEVVDGIGTETRETISHIRAALNRIEQGDYGVCASCGEAIGPERLKVLPEAVCCVKCAD